MKNGVLIKIYTGVCASIIEKNKKDIINTVKSLDEEYVDYIELRLDMIEDINVKLAKDIITTIKEITQKSIILTNRTPKEGGHFQHSEEERINILKQTASLVEITDIEYKTKEDYRQSVIENANKTIISYHNFEETPSKEYLEKIIIDSFKIGDIPKIAVKPQCLDDTLVIVSLLSENKGMIGISMDKMGAYTRVMAPLMGSPITYAAITAESAPGQFDIKTTSNMIKKLKYWFNMTPKEKEIIKALNKVGVDTRYISLYNNNIYINNLKFSKFSRKKEEKFLTDYPEKKVYRSTLFQKICIKVSRTVKNQIKPRDTLYIPDDDLIENEVLYILLEAYKRKYGIKINRKVNNGIIVSNDSLDDFSSRYINQMLNGELITEKLEDKTIYPLMHIPHQWIIDVAETMQIPVNKTRKYEDNSSKEVIEFLEKHIPNVQESIKQSVKYLDENRRI